jgi:hypothetical protein
MRGAERAPCTGASFRGPRPALGIGLEASRAGEPSRGLGPRHRRRRDFRGSGDSAPQAGGAVARGADLGPAADRFFGRRRRQRGTRNPTRMMVSREEARAIADPRSSPFIMRLATERKTGAERNGTRAQAASHG